MGVEERTQAKVPGLEDDSMSESQQRAEERMWKWRGMEKDADSWMNGKMTSATTVPGIPHHIPIINGYPKAVAYGSAYSSVTT